LKSLFLTRVEFEEGLSTSSIKNPLKDGALIQTQIFSMAAVITDEEVSIPLKTGHRFRHMREYPHVYQFYYKSQSP
jgi:hypothetical protein